MLKKIFTVIIILGVLGFVVWYKLKPYVPSPTKIIFQQSPTVQETNGRTNILLLGTGGENHDGPNLTDTIIFASINVKQLSGCFVSKNVQPKICRPWVTSQMC